jgi:hypothetical protein
MTRLVPAFQSGVQIGVQFERNWVILANTKMALESQIDPHCTPLSRSHNPKVAGSNPAPAILVAYEIPANQLVFVAVQFSWFWGSEEGGERAAGLVGGVKVAEVGEEAAVL